MDLTALKTYAEKYNVPITKDDTMQFIIEYINQNKVKTILEIGTAIGFGSINMASCTSVTCVTTVEIDETNYKVAVDNINKFNLGDKIHTNLMDARQFIDNCKQKFDLIYLDGPKGQYINYLPTLLTMLNKGGAIIADNIFFHGMVSGEIVTPASCRSMVKGLRQYIDEVTHNEKLISHIYHFGDGICVTKLK